MPCKRTHNSRTMPNNPLFDNLDRIRTLAECFEGSNDLTDFEKQVLNFTLLTADEDVPNYILGLVGRYAGLGLDATGQLLSFLVSSSVRFLERWKRYILKLKQQECFVAAFPQSLGAQREKYTVAILVDKLVPKSHRK